MGNSTYIYLDENQDVTLKTIKDYLDYYQSITAKTGEQLSWDYVNHAFPYTIREEQDELGRYLYLKGQLDRYEGLLIGVNEKNNFVQITLPKKATHGDKGKGNELAKFLAKKLKGTLRLFNGRILRTKAK